MLTKQALGRGLSWAGRDPASHPDKAVLMAPVAPHARPCPTNWAQGLRPAATQACSTPPCPRASPSEVHTRTCGAELGDWCDRPLTNGREILTPRGKRVHPQETMAFAFSPIQHPGNSIFPTDQCGRGLRASSG